MPTLGQYQHALDEALLNGDQEAATYFQSQIDSATQSRRSAAGSFADTLKSYAGAGAEALVRNPIDELSRRIVKGAGFEPVIQPGGQEGSMLDPVLQGMTGAFADELAGVVGGADAEIKHQLGMGDKDFGQGYEETAESWRERVENYGKRNPVTSTAAEIAGGLSVPVGRAGAWMRNNPFKTAAGVGAVYGAGSEEGGLEERAKGATKGAVAGTAGYGTLRGMSRLGRAFVPAANPASRLPGFRDAVRTLDDSGIEVTPAERIASKEGRLAERATGSFFGQGDRVMERPFELHRRLMRMANFEADDAVTGELSQAAVERAKQRFSRQYDAALRNVEVHLPPMGPARDDIERDFVAMMPHEQKAAVRQVLDSFEAEISRNRTITGPEYKRIRSGLGKQAKQAAKSTNNSYLAPIYRRLQSLLDINFRGSAPPEQARNLRRLDRRYGNFKLLEEAAGNPEAIGTLANRAHKARWGASDEFVNLLRAYQQVLLRGGVQSSGTFENTASVVPPLPSMVRAGGVRVRNAMENVRRAMPSGIPAPIAGTPRLAGQETEDLYGVLQP